MHGHMNVKNPISPHSGHGKGVWQANRWPWNIRIEVLTNLRSLSYTGSSKVVHETSEGTDK